MNKFFNYLKNLNSRRKYLNKNKIKNRKKNYILKYLKALIYFCILKTIN